MEKFNLNALIALTNEDFSSKFHGKRIRVTKHGRITEGIVSDFFISYGTGLVVGFILENKDSIAFAQDIIVEVLN